MIPISKPAIGKNAIKYVARAIKRNDISQGDYIKKFEDKFAKYAGFRHAATCNSGTMALFLAIRALGIEDGEIILPSLTFAATADAVLMAGCTPVFADVDQETFCLSKRTIEPHVNRKTRAIITVGLYGKKPEIKELRCVTGAPIIEDAAENFTNHSKEADVTCFSFFGNKLITTGEGGMVCTNSPTLDEKIRMLRSHGRITGYWHEMRGTNGRMSNINAAIGLSQIEDLPNNLKKRKEIFKWYGIKDCAPWLAWRIVKDKNRTAKKLKQNGIDCRAGFDPLHKMPAYRQEVDLPETDKLAKSIVLLPCFPSLTKKEVNKIIKLL